MPKIDSKQVDPEKLTPDQLRALQKSITHAKHVRALERPKNDKELWDWVHRYLGFDIARTAATEGHQAPFEFLSDAFFERVPRALVKASRSSGKTRILSILHFLNCIHKYGCWSTNVGAIEEQSKRGYDYFKGYCKDPVFEQCINGEPLMSKTEFNNFSRMEILTGGSQKSVSGPQPQKFAGDEIDHWAPIILETALQMTMSKGTIIAQTWLLSSQYYEAGLMSYLEESAEEKRFKVYRWCIFDVMKRCPSCLGRDCPMYKWTNPTTGQEEELCKKRGLISDGHISYEDALNKYTLASAETFALQQLLLKTGGQRGLVYWQYDKQRHDQPWPDDIKSGNWTFIGGVDLRSSGAIEILAFRGGQVTPAFVVDEWFEDMTTPTGIRTAARLFKEKWNVRKFYLDPSQPDEIRDWGHEGLPAVPSPRTPVMFGVKTVRDMFRNVLGDANLFLCKTPRLRWELSKGYRCRRDHITGDYHYDDPVGQNNHACDALRYGIIGYKLSSGGGVGRMF